MSTWYPLAFVEIEDPQIRQKVPRSIPNQRFNLACRKPFGKEKGEISIHPREWRERPEHGNGSSPGFLR
jgi:hypothetical protein